MRVSYYILAVIALAAGVGLVALSGSTWVRGLALLVVAAVAVDLLVSWRRSLTSND